MAAGTKYALAAALTSLLNTTTLDNITVKDIVERANVSRQTFYYHFKDVYDLLEWAFQDKVRRFYEFPADSWQDKLLYAAEVWRANRVLVMNVYHSLGGEYLGRGLERIIRPIIATEMQSFEWKLAISKEDEEFAVSFFTYGVIGTIVRWLEDGMPENLDSVIRDIHALLHQDERSDAPGEEGEA